MLVSGLASDLWANPHIAPPVSPNTTWVLKGTSAWPANFPSIKSLIVQGEPQPLAISGLSVILNSNPSWCLPSETFSFEKAHKENKR